MNNIAATESDVAISDSDPEQGRIANTHQGSSRARSPFGPEGDVAAALRCYRDESLTLRLFMRGRHWLCPMRAVSREVPASGRILDVGSGYGLFANLLATGSADRQITCVEPDSIRVDAARRCSRVFSNVTHVTGIVQQISDGPYDAISILDVLYLLPDSAALEVLRHCRKLIAPDGKLLLKTNDTRPRWKYAVVRIEEWIMVQALAFTFGGEIHFRGEQGYRDLLAAADFEVTNFRKIDGLRPVPHRLYVCRPK